MRKLTLAAVMVVLLSAMPSYAQALQQQRTVSCSMELVAEPFYTSQYLEWSAGLTGDCGAKRIDFTVTRCVGNQCETIDKSGPCSPGQRCARTVKMPHADPEIATYELHFRFKGRGSKGGGTTTWLCASVIADRDCEQIA